MILISGTIRLIQELRAKNVTRQLDRLIHDSITVKATPYNSKCRYGERGAAAAKPKAQIILCAAKVSAASSGYSEPKQGQRSQSARGLCPRSTMRVPQPDIIEHFGNADAVPHTEPQRGASERNRRLRRLLARRSAGAVLKP